MPIFLVCRALEELDFSGSETFPRSGTEAISPRNGTQGRVSASSERGTSAPVRRRTHTEKNVTKCHIPGWRFPTAGARPVDAAFASCRVGVGEVCAERSFWTSTEVTLSRSLWTAPMRRLRGSLLEVQAPCQVP